MQERVRGLGVEKQHWRPSVAELVNESQVVIPKGAHALLFSTGRPLERLLDAVARRANHVCQTCRNADCDRPLGLCMSAVSSA